MGYFHAATGKAAGLAVTSAVLFGASTPFAKLLVGQVDPWLLAALLYLGSGIGLSAVLLLRGAIGIASAEASLRRDDAPWLAAIVASGGVAGPVLLMVGLTPLRAARRQPIGPRTAQQHPVLRRSAPARSAWMGGHGTEP